MKVMLLDVAGGSLRQSEIPVPAPSKNQVLLKVKTCGICRTDLHVIDGDLPNLLGHENGRKLGW